MTDLPQDPIEFGRIMWPDHYFFDRQREIIYSVAASPGFESPIPPADETYAPAANRVGKDFVGGFLIPYLMCTRHPCRIVTTSAKDDHLRVLWGEVNRFIATAKYPLDSRRGGPLLVRHQEIRKIVDGEKDPLSYAIGLVASPDSIAAMQGHHVAITGDGIPRAFFFSDESSSVNDEYYEKASTWFHRAYIFGNTWPCTNFFRRGVKAGDQWNEDKTRCYRRVIKIRAEDSPNVKLGLLERSKGLRPTGRVLVPGVLPWDEYAKYRDVWPAEKQCVSLDAEFYEGRENMMFPAEWLNHAHVLADHMKAKFAKKKRQGRSMGVDPGEGGANTVWTIGDWHGVIKQVGRRTPDTNVIPGETVGLAREYGVTDENVVFDRGNGKQHVDRLRAKGFMARGVGFGEGVTKDPVPWNRNAGERLEDKEGRAAYKNRRAQMYYEARELLDPDGPNGGYAVPAEYQELRRQLSPIPLQRDGEGKIYLPPKDKKDRNDRQLTLKELLGCSPDEADSFVLMVHGLLHQAEVVEAGVYG